MLTVLVVVAVLAPPPVPLPASDFSPLTATLLGLSSFTGWLDSVQPNNHLGDQLGHLADTKYH